MTRWFVTGAGGQLASAFAERLAGTVRLSAEADLDIRDAGAVYAAIHAFAPDVVLHTAAYTNVDGAESDIDAATAVNVDGVANIVRALRGTHTRLVSFSTDYVFAGDKGAPYVETDTPAPLSAYGRTKLGGEQQALQYADSIVVRTSWLFSETGTNFVKTMLAAGQRSAGSGEHLRVVDDQVGCPTYAGHLAEAVLEGLARDLPAGIYHMAGNGYCSWLELAREVVARAGLAVAVDPVSTAELGRPAPRPPFSALASERGAPELPSWMAGVAVAVEKLLASG